MQTTLTTGDAELRAVLHALQGLQAGDGSVQLPENWTGTAGEVARLFNQVVAREWTSVPDRLGRRTRRLRSGSATAPVGSLNADQAK
ncbi:MAG: hypothetical protein WAN86_01805, partial [Hyphomicrobiaceae bacterium]